VKRGPWQTVARDGDTYRLVLGDDVDADIRTFELAVAAAGTLRRERRNADAADRFEQALRAYGGDLIPEAGPADWVIGRRDGLRLAAAEAAQAAAELRLEAGDVSAAISLCERGLQIDRYRDGLWRLLIRCCEVDGNPAAAARAQREYEAVLDDLGLSPE
jgi:DNA-binding SARP family transcriptional activator